MSEKELLEKQAGLIGTFPNTYTFTKNLGEWLIRKYWEQVPVVLIWPSIIGVAMADPVKGWLDSNAAATAIFFSAAMGILHCLPGEMNIVGD